MQILLETNFRPIIFIKQKIEGFTIKNNSIQGDFEINKNSQIILQYMNKQGRVNVIIKLRRLKCCNKKIYSGKSVIEKKTDEDAATNRQKKIKAGTVHKKKKNNMSE